MSHVVQKITHKTKYYELSTHPCGSFWNQLTIWPNIQSIKASGYTGRIGVRCCNKLRGGFFRNNLTVHEAVALFSNLQKIGYREDDLIFQESAPEHLITLQGEVNDRYELTYSTDKTHMRAALRNARHAHGLAARLILRRYLDEASYANFLELFEWYPDHTVEFTAFSSCVGSVPGRNTVVWEVRLY